jgi:hypothetical protein
MRATCPVILLDFITLIKFGVVVLSFEVEVMQGDSAKGSVGFVP